MAVNDDALFAGWWRRLLRSTADTLMAGWSDVAWMDA